MKSRQLPLCSRKRDVGQVLPNGVGHRGEELGCFGPAVMAQELPRPAIELMLGIEILPLDRPHQIRHLIGAVSEGVPLCIFLDLEIEDIGRGLLEANHALETKLLRAPGESGDGDAVAERVVYPSDIHRFRRDLKVGVEQLLVVAVTWPQHHTMLAECDGLLVPVGCNVPNGKYGH